MTELATGSGAAWVVLAHIVLAALAGGAARRIGPRAFLIAALAPALGLVFVALAIGPVLDGTEVTGTIAWAPSVGFELAWRVDTFSLVMVGLIAGIGVAVFVYSASYFGPRDGLSRLVGLLVLFAGAMTGLVLSDNLLGLFLFWEMTSITSYLLIGIDDTRAQARVAALRALMVTGGGGLALLAGFVLLGQAAGTMSLSGVLAASPDGAVVEVALVLVLLGAFTKSAQFPFHFWLPGAMAAPTPVSAYLHSATMVKAGVYVIARFSPAFADAMVWRPLVIVVGLTTMIVGGVAALRQWDIKLLLAHGTVSQLGFMVVLFGLGIEEATLAAVAILVAHALFKATLFLVVGAVDKKAKTRDLRRLHRLGRSAPWLAASGTIAAASMVGLPPLFGFVAKESALEALLRDGSDPWLGAVLVGVVVGSTLTAAYSLRFVWGSFGPAGGTPATPTATIEDRVDAIEPPRGGLLWPALILAVVTVVIGVAPSLASTPVVEAARALDPRVVEGVYLSLWHGFNTALGLSVVAIAGGALLWARPPRMLVTRHVRQGLGADAFDLGLRSLIRGADTITGRIQTGSLPLYMLVILATVLGVPMVALLSSTSGWFDGAALVDRPMQVAVAVVIVTALVAALLTRHRMGAVLAVSAIGYGIAVMFVLQGAPDLALTQLLVETLLLVILVLVLRHLPARFETTGLGMPRWLRVTVAAMSGVVVCVLTLAASGARVAPSVGDDLLLGALPQAGGENVVNVILVDFRAFDTFGEITVITVAALGTMGLVRAARRARQRQGDSRPPRPFRPSPMLDSCIRVIFHTLLLFSVVLLAVGHHDPGGGFIAGLIAGSAFILVFLAGGSRGVRRSEPLAPEVLMGAGVTTAAFAGMWGLAAGGEFLSAASLSSSVPVLGTLKLTSAFVFDLGVYLVVLGLTIAILRSLGREEVRYA